MTGIKHNKDIQKLKFTFGSYTMKNVNGLYADVQFNYDSGCYISDEPGFDTWYTNNVNPHPTITPASLDLGIICFKTVVHDIYDIAKIEYESEYVHQGSYAIWGWLKADFSEIY